MKGIYIFFIYRNVLNKMSFSFCNGLVNKNVTLIFFIENVIENLCWSTTSISHASVEYT